MMKRNIVIAINTVQKLQSSCIRIVCVQPSNSLSMLSVPTTGAPSTLPDSH